MDVSKFSFLDYFFDNTTQHNHARFFFFFFLNKCSNLRLTVYSVIQAIVVLRISFSAYHGHTVAVMDISPYKDKTGRGQPDWVHVVRQKELLWKFFKGIHGTSRNPF